MNELDKEKPLPHTSTNQPVVVAVRDNTLQLKRSYSTFRGVYAPYTPQPVCIVDARRYLGTPPSQPNFERHRPVPLDSAKVFRKRKRQFKKSNKSLTKSLARIWNVPSGTPQNTVQGSWDPLMWDEFKRCSTMHSAARGRAVPAQPLQRSSWMSEDRLAYRIQLLQDGQVIKSQKRRTSCVIN